ncbi:MAG: DUF58 domain-containing protein, partial [Aeromonas veronii]
TLGDFDTLRTHQAGEPLSRVAWKQLAQGRGLLTKQFHEPQQDDTHLTLQRIAGGDLEQRLAVLAWWCADYGKRGIPFTLTLANQTLGPDSGAAFVQRCLLALAQFDATPSKSTPDAAK